MQKQTQIDTPETLEIVRARLAERRAESREEDTEAVARAVREETPCYLLGSPAADAIVCVLAGLLPAGLWIAYTASLDHRILRPETAIWVAYAAPALLVALWVGFFVGMRHVRTARIALAWTLLLYSLLAVFDLGMVAYVRMHGGDVFGLSRNISPGLFVGAAIAVAALQGFAFWKAYRKR